MHNNEQVCRYCDYYYPEIAFRHLDDNLCLYCEEALTADAVERGVYRSGLWLGLILGRLGACVVLAVLA